MSNFTKPAYHPKEKVVRMANFLDDYFGPHEYGVRFPGDDHVYKPEETDIPHGVVFVPKPKRKPRSSTKNVITGTWTKRDDKSGKFMDVKADAKPFKGVRKEKRGR